MERASYESRPEKRRVAAYCRVSTDSEEQESSYEAQCTHYTAFIQANPAWRFAGIYADEGISGTSVKRREEFSRMLADCEDGLIDMVITKSISRWARNTIDSLNSIRRLKELGIPVLFEKENINTLDARGEVLITIMSSLAQQESESISQNVSLGIRYRMQQGRGRLNTSVFLGYGRGAEPGTLVIVPEEAEIVRRIFREYLEGYSPAMICRRLEADGVPTGAGGRAWYPSTVASMLENEKYAGDALLQKYYTVDFLTHRTAKNTGQLPQYYVEGHHAPIVPRAVFEQAQGERMRRAALKNEPARLRFGSAEALPGRLICGLCGRPLKRYTMPEGAPCEWRCRRRAGEKKTTGRETRPACACRIVREDEAKAAILKAFSSLPAHREALLDTQARLREEIARLNARIDAFRREERIPETRLSPPATDAPTPAYASERAAALRRERDSLMLERAEHAEREMRIRLLLELIGLMGAAGQQPLAVSIGPACSGYEDFFRRTRYRPPAGALDARGALSYFDDGLIVRYLDSVTVREEGYDVRFKAGIEIFAERG